METNTNLQNLSKQTGHASFFGWYYSIAPKKIIEIWKGYLAAILHYYSVSLLLRTLVSPWHRDTTGYGRGFDFKRYLSIWSLNMVSRGVGFVVRLSTILFAMALEAIILVSGLIFLAFWFAAPVIFIFLFYYGGKLLL